ncbi:MAG: guanylate kinase [Bacilli bacterium]|jgi:guanylate kinase|nr:guanylate kinase [Bacilli bacterium]MDY0209684.1 guanylate kinase [Bacilli bacterium]
MKLDDKGLLVVISGPSGVGKGTIRSALFEMEGHDLVYSISLTTRKPRSDEINGREYWFISKEEFEQKIKDNKMLEYAEFVGNYYGTLLDTVEEQLKVGKEVVLEIEVTGAMQVRERMSDAVFIFIAPPSYEVLENRLKSRGTEDSEHIKERIVKAKKELGLAYQYDYIVVNDEIKNAADKIMAIIRAEHARTERTIHKYNSLLGVKNND